MPGKNIRLLAGKPMIAYTIGAAHASGLFGRVIVSTDDRKIAEIAQQFGAEVPFLRDADLADDFTPVSAVTADALFRLDPGGNKFEAVAQLMPNCPLRNAEDIRASHAQFSRTGTGAQISIVRYGWQNPWWAMRRNERHGLEPLFQEQLAVRSQDLPELFCPTGAIWWARTEVLRRTKTFHTPERTGWEISWQHGIDIDTIEDFALADALFHGSSSENCNMQRGQEV